VEERDEKGHGTKLEESQEPLPVADIGTTTSTPSDLQFAVLPHGETLEGWTNEAKKELDDLVRHMLHSRRARFKRSMRGFGQYVRRREFTLQHAIDFL
jgi:hypothetical protein